MLALSVAVATTALSIMEMAASSRHPLIYWFSGWHPTSGVVVGVDYVVDPLGSALAALAGVLVSGALIYSWRFFDSVGGRYNALVLIFLAASVDLCLTGDLFNLFVAFELVAVTGFVLTGYNADRRASLQGAINFAVTNSLAGMAVLLGVGLLYAHTGALNLAEIGHVLAGHRAEGVVVVSFALLVGGFMVKAAVVPFHFWLPDAYGTAPIPVCVLFSGIMSELGLFALARVWETVFSGLQGGAAQRLQLVLIGLGIATAVVGGVMALAQTNLKRMLAFVTMSHVGLYLIGFGLLSPLGLAGASLLVVGDGLAKGALFLGVGIVQQRRSTVDELKLGGRGGGLWLSGGIVAFGALALADLPPFVSSHGKDLIVAAADRTGMGWIEVVVAFCVIMSSGAVLRAAGRIWLGWGAGLQRSASAAESSPAESGTDDDTGDEEIEPPDRRRTPLVMLVPPLLLLAATLGLGLVPGMGQGAANASASFVNRPAYAAAVLDAKDMPVPRPKVPATTIANVLIDLGEAAGAVGLGSLALVRSSWAVKLRRTALAGTAWLRHQHSGHVGDQVTWLVAGLALLAGLSGLALH
ncbi:MAG: complex I subunit 5 family protein [Acidimicrobiales bacterium]